MDANQAKDKVVKLLNLAKDQGAASNEAERALSQAEALMRKFGIEAGECLQGDAAQDFDWANQFTPYGNKYHQAKSLPKWYQFIATGIAKFTDTIVRVHNNQESGMGVGFYGERSDVGFAVWLMDYLRDTTQRAAAERKDLGRMEREAFRLAMAVRLSSRMRELRAERDQAFQASTGTALVVVSDKLAKRDEEFGAAEYQKSRVRYNDRDAAMAGQSAADRVGFNRPLGAQENHRRLAA